MYKLHSYTKIRESCETRTSPTVSDIVWWLLVFIVCAFGCSSFIYEVYRKWERSPVIVSFATKGTPIYTIPFPAITICPETKFNQNILNLTYLYNKYAHSRNKTANTEKQQFEFASLLCDFRTSISGNLRPSPTGFYKFLDRVKPRFQPSNCHYMGAKMSCGNYKPIITDEGICYTFNMLSRSEIFRDNVVHYSNFHVMNRISSHWNLEDGYDEDAGYDAYPVRAFMAGAKNALSLNLLTRQRHVDHICKRSLPGYKVLLHTSMRYPRLSQEYFRVPLNQAVVAAVTPLMIATSVSVKNYNPNRRDCYFQSERRLRYFKIYSSLNCKLECVTNYTLNKCGCVDFYMPRENGTRICGVQETICIDNANGMQVKDLYHEIENLNQSNKYLVSSRKLPGEDINKCNCLPICSDLTYNVALSQTNWEWFDEFTARGLNNHNQYNESSDYMSSLTIYFKSDSFIPSIRNELYGPVDFLANFGGLLGLFTGFSVLSLMEIIYFLSIRMICNCRLYGYWSGKEQ